MVQSDTGIANTVRPAAVLDRGKRIVNSMPFHHAFGAVPDRAGIDWAVNDLELRATCLTLAVPAGCSAHGPSFINPSTVFDRTTATLCLHFTFKSRRNT